MKSLNIIFLILFTNMILSCTNEKVNLNDRLDQNTFPAFNKELLVDIEGDTISAYALIADGEIKKETVIIIKGYPGHDTNFDLAQDLRSNKYNVILFNHRGAWGSQGRYTYSNCLEDIEKLIDFLSRHKNSEELRIKQDSFILIGRSLGSGIALIQGSKMDEVNKIIAISSVNYGSIMEKYSSLSELGSFKSYMQKQTMINHDIDEFLTELLTNKVEYELANYNTALGKKEVLLIEDSSKNSNWISKLTNAEVLTIKSDHNFTSERTDMINEIINWLGKD